MTEKFEDKKASTILLEHENRLSDLEREAKGWKAFYFFTAFLGVICANIFTDFLDWLISMLF